MSSSLPSALEALAAALVEGLTRELRLTPKPGLVDLDGCGAHRDLSLATMQRSIALVGEYLSELCASLERGEPLGRQVAIGQEAERRMMSELGTNTHKGAVFLGGLLVVARHRASDDGEGAWRRAMSATATELLASRRPLATHGAAARSRFRVGGIVQEALRGLPCVFEAALPAFRAVYSREEDLSCASFAMLARLMQTVEDTTALHRCGLAGLAQLREDGRGLEWLLASSGDHLGFLRERSALYARIGLTMGGVADLLGMAFGALVYLGEIPAPHLTASRPRPGSGPRGPRRGPPPC